MENSLFWRINRLAGLRAESWIDTAGNTTRATLGCHKRRLGNSETTPPGGIQAVGTLGERHA